MILHPPQPPPQKYKLDPMSDEQQLICDHIKKGNNAVVDACAGSGKSTTILSIAQEMPHHKFIQLTYNSMLCADSRKKVFDLGLSNLDVCTYHGLVVKNYDPKGYTDTVIRRVISHNISPKNPIPRFHVLVLDEVQDMTFLYFKLIVKFCRDMGHPTQILILGDYMQGLYEFKGADTRFLTKALQIWSKFPLIIKNGEPMSATASTASTASGLFAEFTLKMSYRITQPMADFVNNVMLGERRLLACRDGERVMYLRQQTFNAGKFIIYKINSLIADGKATADDFFILGASIRASAKEIRLIENELVRSGIPCYVPVADDDKIDERVIEGKVVFSTFHSVKGRQRKYVFIIGFNETYFDYYARTVERLICPNTLYVATTRATHGLCMVESHNMSHDRPPKFLKLDHLGMKTQPYIDFRGMHQTLFEEKPTPNENQKIKHKTEYITPSDLIRFIPETVLDEINPILEEIFIRVPSPVTWGTPPVEINFPNVIKTNEKYYEDVSDINGIAIPFMYFDKYMVSAKEETEKPPLESGIDTIARIIEKEIKNHKTAHKHSFLTVIFDTLYKKIKGNGEEETAPTTTTPRSPHCKMHSIEDYLKISNLFYAVKEKLYFKIKQINENDYRWLSDEMVETAFRRMDEIIGRDMKTAKTNENACSPKIEYVLVDKTTPEDKYKHIDELLKTHFPEKLFRFREARVDLMTENTVWELKCTSSLTNEHYLQVVIYAWIWRMIHENMLELENIRDFRLFNIKTGEQFRLNATTDQLNSIILAVLKGKYLKQDKKDDDEFLRECWDILLENPANE